ncbi:NAD(P)-dependent alcohol dehydrogenase [Microbacterium sp. NPDC077663]|uniref:NAD(P)-dependent alcohol dehydrogenase n=1 Tax=Microbacterium sp. NPDC077663 TaxID=3364189 RepID=UPI0037C7DDD2
MSLSMRAAQYSAYGSADVIEIRHVPVPSPGTGEVLVRVGATSITGAEVALRAGKLRLLSGKRFPKGLGMDFSGEIATVGNGVEGLSTGQRVWGVLDRSTIIRQPSLAAAAEYVVVDARFVSPTPVGLTDDEAVALIGGTTALTALRDKARLQSGERLLVRGGTGGVGYIAVQLGRAMGASVTALVSEASIAEARRLGAHEALDYRSVRPEDLGEFDVIFDTVGSQMARYRQRLTPHGRMVTISFAPIVTGLIAIAVSTIHGRRRIRTFSGNPDRTLLDDYASYVTSIPLRALISGSFDLENLADAHRASEAGGRPGKHVVIVRAATL